LRRRPAGPGRLPPAGPGLARRARRAALVAAAGVVAVADLALRLLGERPQPIRRAALAALAVVVAAAVGLECLGRYEDYFGDYGAQVAPQFQYGLEQALGYARDQQAGYDEIWLADTTAGYIYVLFYAAWPPSDVHQRLEVRRAPGRFNRVGPFDKLHLHGPTRFSSGRPRAVGRALAERPPNSRARRTSHHHRAFPPRSRLLDPSWRPPRRPRRPGGPSPAHADTSRVLAGRR